MFNDIYFKLNTTFQCILTHVLSTNKISKKIKICSIHVYIYI